MLALLVAASVVAGPVRAFADTFADRTGLQLTVFRQTGDAGSPPSAVAVGAIAGRTGEGNLDASRIEVDANDGGVHSVVLRLTPPSGVSFAVGDYGFTPTSGDVPSRPGVAVAVDGVGCDGLHGSGLTVWDLGLSGSTITHADITFTQTCNGNDQSVFGELRYDEPLSSSPVLTASHVTWPTLNAGQRGDTVPLVIANTSSASVTVRTGAVAGDAAEFPVTSNDCLDAVLAPGARCTLNVAFVPQPTPGYRSAAFDVAVDGVHQTVSLSGSVSTATSEVQIASPPTDPRAAGEHLDYNDANALISWEGQGHATGASIYVEQWETISGRDALSVQWTIDLYPASGDVLRAGATYTGATDYPFNGSGNGLSVGDYRDHVGCDQEFGSFTVQDVSFSALDGSLQSLRATFVDHCESSAAPPLTGTIAFDATAPADHLAVPTRTLDRSPYPTALPPQIAVTAAPAPPAASRGQARPARQSIPLTASGRSESSSGPRSPRSPDMVPSARGSTAATATSPAMAPDLVLLLDGWIADVARWVLTLGR